MQNKIYIFLFVYFVFIIPCKGQPPLIGVSLITAASPGSYTTSNAVTGWTVESTINPTVMGIACTGSLTSWTSGSPEFSIVSTPVFGNPYVPGNPFSIDNVTIPNSPLGGVNVARLQDAIGAPLNGLVTRMRTTIQVTNMNNYLEIAYAGSWDGSGHTCCEQPTFHFKVYNCLGTAINTYSLNLTPSGPNCTTGIPGFSVSGSPSSVSWTNWTVRSVDLTMFIGSCVTIEVINSDCSGNIHHGSVYFDARTTTNLIANAGPNVNPINPGGYVNFCSGSNQAQIIAPFGFSNYQWYAPGNPFFPIANTQVLTLNNPIWGTTYTVQMQNPAGYTYVYPLTLQYSSVSIIGMGSGSTTCGGASGSATVVGNGSGTGYNYNWYAPGNPTPIGTGSVVSNLAAGIYTVGVSAIGSVGCGSAVATVTVGTIKATTGVYYFCNNDAYLSAPTNTNVQWYNGLSPIPSNLGGTAQNYTVTSPYNNQFLWLSYNTSLTCKDSVKIILAQATPGNLSVSFNKLICQGANNGQAVLSMTPAIGSMAGANSFSVLNTLGTFSTSPSPYALNTFTVNNLSAGTTYSVNSFDGTCKYTATLSPNVFTPVNFSVSPNSPTLCPGNNVVAGVNFSSNPTSGQYTYTWSPNIFLLNNFANSISTVITPTTALGTINTMIYTVAVTPSVVNCVSTRTLAITIVNLATPTISSIPPLCINSPAFTITANPAGGTFSGYISGTNSVVITPSLMTTGTKYFVYSLLPGTCVSGVPGTFTINPLPVINILGSSSVCAGQSTTLSASGGNSYVWNTSATTPTITVTPTAATIYSVTGTNTLTTCSGIKTFSVSVKPLPVLTVNGTLDICEGESTSLTGSGADSYQWIGLSNNSSIMVSPLSTTSYTLIGTQTNSCANSKTVSVVVSPCTGINEQHGLNESIKIYPNPTSGNLFIELGAATTIILYNQLGSVIFEHNLNSGKHGIDLSNYSSGLYFIKCAEKDHSRVIKIIKTD